MWKNPLLRLWAAGCGAVLLAGCGGSSTSSATGTSTVPADSPMTSSAAGASRSAGTSESATSSSAASPASSSPSTAPATAAQLKKMVLQPQDLPAGWKGTPYHAQAGQARDDAALSSCVGARDTQHDKVAEAHSADYTMMGEGTISSSAIRYRSQSDIDADIEMLHNRRLEGCLEQTVKKDLATSLPAGSKVEAASIKITPGSAGGPSNVVATGTGTVQLSVNHQRAAVYLDIVFITGPLIEADVQTETLGAPLPASVLKSLVASVAGRAAKG